MAEIPYGGDALVTGHPVRSTAATLSTAANWAGAVISLSLIVGVGTWGYRMLARDVSGVPVVRAASDRPMRVQPDDPGGRPALHQGLSVNRVAGEGAAARPADRLVLAPAPIALADEDQPSGAVQLHSEAMSDVPEQPLPPAAELPQMASIQALAEHLASGASPLGDVVPESDTALEKIEPVVAVAQKTPEAAPMPTERKPEPVVMKPVVKGGIKRSLRPVLRPGGLKAVAAAAPAAMAAIEVDAASIPPGTRLAQLGAYDSAETARGEWAKLSQRFGDYLEGKKRVIQRAQSGGRVFYRLRAMGFADLNDARRFCSALVAERADCIPVTTR